MGSRVEGEDLDGRFAAEHDELRAQWDAIFAETDRLKVRIDAIQSELRRLEGEIMSSTFIANPSNATLEEARTVNRKKNRILILANEMNDLNEKRRTKSLELSRIHNMIEQLIELRQAAL